MHANFSGPIVLPRPSLCDSYNAFHAFPSHRQRRALYSPCAEHKGICRMRFFAAPRPEPDALPRYDAVSFSARCLLPRTSPVSDSHGIRMVYCASSVLHLCLSSYGAAVFLPGRSVYLLSHRICNPVVGNVLLPSCFSYKEEWEFGCPPVSSL